MRGHCLFSRGKRGQVAQSLRGGGEASVTFFGRIDFRVILEVPKETGCTDDAQYKADGQGYVVEDGENIYAPEDGYYVGVVPHGPYQDEDKADQYHYDPEFGGTHLGIGELELGPEMGVHAYVERQDYIEYQHVRMDLQELASFLGRRGA